MSTANKAKQQAQSSPTLRAQGKDERGDQLNDLLKSEWVLGLCSRPTHVELEGRAAAQASPQHGLLRPGVGTKLQLMASEHMLLRQQYFPQQ